MNAVEDISREETSQEDVTQENLAKITFHLPDLGEGLAEVEIVDWHVEEAAEVEIDDDLVTVLTDKSVITIPSPYAGRVHRCFNPGEKAPTGAPLALFEESDRGADSPEAEGGAS